MNILLFGPSASVGTGYGLLQRNIGIRLHRLGKKKVKCSSCKWETYIEPQKNKCIACDSENIKVIEEADKSYKGPYYNVFQMGLHTIGEIDNRYGFPILPVGSNDPCGSDMLPYYIMQYNIDVLITIKDIFPETFNYIKEVVRQTNVYWIHHCTIYSTPLSPFRAKVLNNVDLIIAPSNFCYNVIKNAGYDNVKRIYHGVDLEVFKPNPEQRKKDRKELKREEDKFVFLYVAKNVPLQKDYPVLFHAYKLFLQMKEVKCNKCGYEFESNQLELKCTKCNSQDLKITENRKKNTILRCHTNPLEIGGFDLGLMIKRFGIGKNVLFTKGHNSNFTLPPEEMAKIYNYADVLVVCSTGECLHPDSHIISNFNYKKMNEIKVGDLVLTKNGWKKVNKLFRREYKGDLICITPYNLKDILKLTPEHEVLAIKKNNRELSRVKIKLEWIQSKDLKKGDLLAIPRKISDNKPKKTLELSDYLNRGYIEENGRIYHIGKNQFGSEFKCKIKSSLPKHVKINKDLIKFMAYYLSEGCGWVKGKQGMVIISNNSQEFINEVKKIGKNIFNLNATTRINKKENYAHTTNIHFNNNFLAEIMINMCGRYSNHKKLPSWFMDLEEEDLIYFFKEYIKGDGNIYYDKRNNSPTASITTTSKKLFNQMKILMFKCGILPSCKIRDFDNENWNRAYILELMGNNYDKLYNPNLKKQKQSYFLIDDNYIYVLIRKIEKEKYDGFVHDLEINGEHNYTSSCIVHNSFNLPTIESMACGKPVIAMRFSAPIELINNSGAGLLADIKGTFTTRLCSDLCINDELNFAKCMDQIYSDEKLRERLNANALKFVKSFDWKLIIKEWEGLLR